MKKITLLVASALFCLTGLAQVSEDFDEGIPEDWQLVVNTGTCNWENTADVPTGDAFTTPGIVFDDDACGNGADASNVTIVSDLYDVSAGAGTLNYDVYFQESGTQTFTVEVYDGTDWVQVALYDEDLPGIVSESLDISGYTNTDFLVRWTYDDNGGEWGWGAGIDNFSIDGTLSAGKNELQSFAFYPNPAERVVNISAQESIARVSVYTISGQLVLEKSIQATSHQVDVSNLSTGAYFMRVLINGQEGTYKLIKQ